MGKSSIEGGGMDKFVELHQTFTIPSRVEEISKALEEVRTYIERKGYGGVKYRRMIGALYEAIVNAIVHGNKKDGRKKVRILCSDDEEKFQVRVTDEGNGFDASSLSNPYSPENIARPGGRGICIIRNFVHELSFNEKGNEITMTIKK